MKKILAVTALAVATVAAATPYVIINPQQDQNVEIKVNDGGSYKTALSVIGSTGKVKVGIDGFDSSTGGLANDTDPGLVGTGNIRNVHVAADADINGSKLADGTITTNKIANGAIINEDISASAAIAGSKIAPASATEAGVVTTGNQTFAGHKQFNGTVTSTGLSTSGTLGVTGNSVFYGTSTVNNILYANGVQVSPGLDKGLSFLRSSGFYLRLYLVIGDVGTSCSTACTNAGNGMCLGAASTSQARDCNNTAVGRGCLCLTGADSL